MDSFRCCFSSRLASSQSQTGRLSISPGLCPAARRRFSSQIPGEPPDEVPAVAKSAGHPTAFNPSATTPGAIFRQILPNPLTSFRPTAAHHGTPLATHRSLDAPITRRTEPDAALSTHQRNSTQATRGPRDAAVTAGVRSAAGAEPGDSADFPAPPCRSHRNSAT